MEKHRLITSQWCKLLTGARWVTNNVNDPQGTTVQFTWCEKRAWCRTPRKIFWSKVIGVNLLPKVRNLPLRHASFKVLKGVVPKSTSWIMSCCRQEVTRHRRALMNPTSMTRNGANDFVEVKTIWWYRVQGGSHERMKGEGIVADETQAGLVNFLIKFVEHISDTEMDW